MRHSIVRFHVPNQPPRYGRMQADQSVEILDAPPWLGGMPTGESVEGFTLLAPCLPGKILCVGKNYKDHAAEMAGLSGDGSVPSEPLLFFKPPSAVIAAGDTIHYPEQSQRVDYEGELALVIGKQARKVRREAAQDYIFGYTIANDVTARDLQKRDGQWTRAKGFDTFCPLGPVIVESLALDAQLITRLNGKVMQSSTVDQMVFDPAFLIAYISAAITLEPGDVILTGTPSGIGPMQIGDQISVEIAGIGILENVVG
ncbi:MAG: fumarylacetoacetate hydrolase family protein [Anaerolineae bacterium]|nr:fumarylacetoacetate hydrolase family protein [Gloeobacterales cyanobacterium ES-bin-313]